VKKFNLLSSFPKSKRNLKERNINKKNIQLALKYSKEYFDGNRSQGYGGYYYDGRWVNVARKVIKIFNLKNNSRFLDVGCAKGFLMHDLKTILPKLKLYGIDISQYAKDNSILNIKKNIEIMNCKKLRYKSNFFDGLVAINVVHNLEIKKCKEAIKEIQRVSNGKAFIQVDAYRDELELKILKKWILTAKTYLKPKEWVELFKECGYTGYYDFTILKTNKWLKL
jgi:ubiquinone/menaquinone biosynthesis C-methylase UbiE